MRCVSRRSHVVSESCVYCVGVICCVRVRAYAVVVRAEHMLCLHRVCCALCTICVVCGSAVCVSHVVHASCVLCWRTCARVCPGCCLCRSHVVYVSCVLCWWDLICWASRAMCRGHVCRKKNWRNRRRKVVPLDKFIYICNFIHYTSTCYRIYKVVCGYCF